MPQFPNRNYLAAQVKNLERAGDLLAYMVRGPIDIYPRRGPEMEEALRAWDQAKKGLLGLAGK